MKYTMSFSQQVVLSCAPSPDGLPTIPTRTHLDPPGPNWTQLDLTTHKDSHVTLTTL